MGGFSSCSDFLDRYPLEELSDGSFWKTENDAEMAVSNLYNILPTWDVDEAINSDDAVHGIPVHMGNSQCIQEPEEDTAHNDISYDFFCKLGEKHKSNENNDDACYAVSSKSSECFHHFGLLKALYDSGRRLPESFRQHSRCLRRQGCRGRYG